MRSSSNTWLRSQRESVARAVDVWREASRTLPTVRGRFRKAERGTTPYLTTITSGLLSPGLLALACVLVGGVSVARATHPYDIKVINLPSHRHNIKDFTVEVLGIPKIDGIDSTGGFGATPIISKNKHFVKFDGGSVAPGEDSTVRIDLDHKVQGISPVVCDEASWSSDPLAFGVSPMIFSGAIFSGEETFPSISIPAGEYLYLYEIQWTGSGAGPISFEVVMPEAPTSMGLLDDTWTPASLFHTPGPITVDPMGFTIGQEWTLSPGMLPDSLTGVGGAMPTSWTFGGGKMVAEFATPLASGERSSVMWFTSAIRPEFGSPNLAAHNSALLDGSGTLFSAAAIAPIPEQATVFLAAIGTIALTVFQRKLRAQRPTSGTRAVRSPS